LDAAAGHGKPCFATEEAISFWKRGSLPVTAGKLRLRLGNLVGFTAARLRVSENTDLDVMAQTLDRAEQRRSERKACDQRCLQRVSVIGVKDGPSDGEAVVVTFFLIKYQSIVASRREISFARQFSRVSLTNRIEINFVRQFFGITFFIIAMQ
jgi:hypothetical protein